MANSTDPVNLVQSRAAFLAAVDDLFVTPKIDRPGLEVDAENIRERVGRLWGNAVDDVLLAVQLHFVRRTYDNRQAISASLRQPASAALITTASAAGSASVDFTIPARMANGTCLWLHVSAVEAACDDIDVSLFSDSARTKAIYVAAGVDPSTAYVEGTPFACIPDDGTELASRTVYGTILNNSATTTAFEIQAVMEGV